MSHITLKLFAQLREAFAFSEQSVPLEAVHNQEQLLQWLGQQYPEHQALLKQPLLMAVNQEMIRPDAIFQAGDEVALFPPVTGG